MIVYLHGLTTHGLRRHVRCFRKNHTILSRSKPWFTDSGVYRKRGYWVKVEYTEVEYIKSTVNVDE